MLHDLRIACRRLLYTPVFTAVMITILAVGIGANAAILGIADAVLFRPLPYMDPSRVFVLRLADPFTRRTGVSSPIPIEYIQAIERYHRGFAAVGELGPQSMVVHLGGMAEWLSTSSVTPDYFRVLGVRPLRGRFFDARDTVEPGRAAVISYECWQRLFAGDDGIVGHQKRIGEDTFEIIGVLPRGFVFPSVFRTADRFGVSGRPDFVTVFTPARTGARRATVISDPIVRLKTGVTRERAQAEMDALLRPIKVASNEPGASRHLPILEDVPSMLFSTGQTLMGWLLVAAGLVALIVSVNLAIMLMARTRRREPEMGVRVALGARRWQLVRPMLIETLIIGFIGGWAGLLLASLTFHTLLRQVPPIVYGGASVGIDLRVMAVALALGLCSGLLFGVAPAWRAAGVDVQAMIHGRPRRARQMFAGYLPHPLVTSQVAVAIVLVFAAVCAGRAFISVLRIPLGFDPQRIITLRVFPPENAQSTPFYRDAIERLARRYDVVAAGAAATVPLDNYAPWTFDEKSIVGVELVLPGYFETIGATRLRGRLPVWGDVNSGEGVCVVSESASRALFRGLDPLGRVVHVKKGVDLVVVGVVADLRKSMDEKGLPSVFTLPYDRAGGRGMVLVVRMRDRNPRAPADLRSEIGRLSPDEPVVAAWWTDKIDALVPFRNPRLQTLVLGTFAALALGLTTLGIFAVVSYLVVARWREFGVRLALGALPHSVVALAVRQALLPVITGSALGLVLTRWLSDLVKAQSYGIKTDDWLTLVTAVATVATAATIAACLPARAAGRINPVDVLRTP